MNKNPQIIDIIIAEDFDIIREDIAEIINSQPDMRIVGEAKSGNEAVELAKKINCDIIIMDIEMDCINDGIKAAIRILEFDPYKKIIFLTAHETDNFVIDAMATGAKDYVVKGLADEDLLRHIRSTYEGESQLDSQIQNILVTEFARLRQSEKSLLYFINNLSKLTLAEREIISMLIEGKKVKDIANARTVELSTVKAQIQTLLKKFECGRTSQIVQIIKELNLTYLFK